jgi:hypothetical protein
VEDTAVGREAAALYAELAVLPKQREAVCPRHLRLRYDEVATALGTSRPAVEALLFRASAACSGASGRASWRVCSSFRSRCRSIAYAVPASQARRPRRRRQPSVSL